MIGNRGNHEYHYTERTGTNEYKKVVRRPINREKDRVNGILLGFFLIAGAIILLFWNEMRQDMSELMVNAVEIETEISEPDESYDGMLVSLHGSLYADEYVGDNMYLEPGKFIAVKREVEMYSWGETEYTETEEYDDGTESVTTTYSYSKEWTSNPDDSSMFNQPGYYNPEKTIPDATFTASSARMDYFHMSLDGMKLPPFQDIPLSSYNTVSGARLEGEYIYVGYGSMYDPDIGDMRIKYKGVSSGQICSVFGLLFGDTLEPYNDPKYGKLYRAVAGNKEEALAFVHNEYIRLLWGLRAGGITMFFVGLALFLGLKKKSA